MTTDHPFDSGFRNLAGEPVLHLDVPGRMRVISTATADQLRVILAMHDLQATVRNAAAARLRRLEKDGAHT